VGDSLTADAAYSAAIPKRLGIATRLGNDSTTPRRTAGGACQSESSRRAKNSMVPKLNLKQQSSLLQLATSNCYLGKLWRRLQHPATVCLTSPEAHSLPTWQGIGLPFGIAGYCRPLQAPVR